MEEEKAKPPHRHALGDDLSRLSLRELEELRAAVLAEAERIGREIAAKGSSRAAADAFFRR
jgi:uncharacterized small protein (DUF1192 family)